MIGAQPDYDGLRIAPVLPDEWDTVHLSRAFRDAHYEIDVTRGDVNEVQVKVDGQPIDGNLLPYDQFNGEHKVDVVIPR